MVAEAGISAAIAYLEAGNAASGTLPENGSFPDKWSYEVEFKNTYPNGASLPTDVIRVVSKARQTVVDGPPPQMVNRLEATAYLRRIDNVVFDDMMRIQNVGTLTGGMGAEYFDPVHVNGSLNIDFPNGIGGGGVPTFHKKITWSDTSQSEPNVTGLANYANKWDKIHTMDAGNSSNSAPGFEHAAARTLPDLNRVGSSPTNLFDGSNAPGGNWLSKVLNGAVAPSSSTVGVHAFQGGGIYVSGDQDVDAIELSLVDTTNSSYPKINPVFNNDSTDGNMWQNAPAYTPSTDVNANANSSANLSQKMVFKIGTETFTVILDQQTQQTKVYQGTASPTASDTPISTVSGLSSDYVWVNGFSNTVHKVTGVNKGKRVFLANNIELNLNNVDDPLIRADVEPSQVAGGYGSQSKKAFTPAEGSGVDRDGFTFATWGSFKISNNGQVITFNGNSSQKWYFAYYNILSYGNIYTDIDPQANLTFHAAGSFYTSGSLQNLQTNNDNFRFAQDPTNKTVAGLSGKIVYNVVQYFEQFYRS